MRGEGHIYAQVSLDPLSLRDRAPAEPLQKVLTADTEAGFGIVASFIIRQGIPMDPNAEMLGSISGEEQEAWWVGHDRCSAKARADVYAELGALQSELADDYHSMWLAIGSDPEVVIAERGWVACMRSRGHDVSGWAIMVSDLERELADFAQTAMADLAQRRESELDARQEEERDNLAGRELELANGSNECLVNHKASLLAAIENYESRFRASAGADLKRLKTIREG